MKEEEVKKANRIILATKCSIIRGAQIAEKNEIAREFHNENLRLEKIMLEERDKALVEEELKREQERKNLLKYSKEIRKQLEEREMIRAKEVERIEEEAFAMKKALDVIEKVKHECGGLSIMIESSRLISSYLLSRMLVSLLRPGLCFILFNKVSFVEYFSPVWRKT